jgi:GDP-L-fucose synthase
MQVNSKIYIAGHNGLVGSSILRKLEREEFKNIIVRSSKELDLRNQVKVFDFFMSEKPEYVFLSAAKVGGINANNIYRAEFLYDNLMIELNIINAAYIAGVTKLLFLGSSCIYPKLAPQPLKEEYLLSGYLEETNKPYAIAKIAGIELCNAYREQYGCNFISAMPTNSYGPNDNYDLENSHVLPALLRKFITAKRNNAKSVTIWGTGKVKREFLYVDDLVDACLFLMKNYNEPQLVNIGVGKDVSIDELARLIKKIVGFDGEISYDSSKPDGTPRKLLDVSKINRMGWKAKIELEDGITNVFNLVKDYAWV